MAEDEGIGEEAGRRLRAFAETAPVPIWMTDDRGKVIFGNAALADWLGPHSDDAFAHIHPQDRVEFDAALVASLNGQRPFHAEARWRRADGQWRWFRCEGLAQRNEKGALAGVCACNIDVTDTHRVKDMLREEIKQAERQVLKGKPAAATHAFNNIVAVIVSGLRLLQDEANADRRTTIIENIRQALEGAGIDSKGGDRAPALPKSAPAARAGTPTRILVVEDGDGVAGVACTMLERMGYAATRVASAEDALDLLARDQDFGLVFSDVFMHGMNGVALADRIERDWPALPVLLTSGFSGREITGARPLLAKPYSMEQLAEAIAGVVKA